MRSHDSVPCYYAGDLRSSRLPAELRPRAALHKLKKAGLGRFVDNGQAFQFNVLKEDLPLSVGNMLPFSKPHCYGDKLHYETPHAGDRSIWARHYRKLIHPSSRSLFNHQALPMAVSA